MKITCKCLKFSADTWLLIAVAAVVLGVGYLSIGNNNKSSGSDPGPGNSTANATVQTSGDIDNEIIDALIAGRLLSDIN